MYKKLSDFLIFVEFILNLECSNILGQRARSNDTSDSNSSLDDFAWIGERPKDFQSSGYLTSYLSKYLVQLVISLNSFEKPVSVLLFYLFVCGQRPKDLVIT